MVGDPSMNFFGGFDMKGTPGSKRVISLSFPRTLKLFFKINYILIIKTLSKLKFGQYHILSE